MKLIQPPDEVVGEVTIKEKNNDSSSTSDR